MQEKRRGADMCSGPILKGMLIFAAPIMVMNLLQLLFNAAGSTARKPWRPWARSARW